MKEANINGDIFGTIDITDLLHLVDYMFQSGPPPAICYLRPYGRVRNGPAYSDHEEGADVGTTAAHLNKPWGVVMVDPRNFVALPALISLYRNLDHR